MRAPYLTEAFGSTVSQRDAASIEREALLSDPSPGFVAAPEEGAGRSPQEARTLRAALPDRGRRKARVMKSAGAHRDRAAGAARTPPA